MRVLSLGALGAWLTRAVELACVAAIVWRTIERGTWARQAVRPALVPTLRESMPSLTG